MYGTVIDIKGEWILVRSELGSFWGKWPKEVSPMLPVKPPQLKSYDFELDWKGKISPEDIAIVEVGDHFSEIRNEEGATYLTGLVDDVEDGVLTLRLSPVIIMIETMPDRDYNAFLGRNVQIKVSELCLYDTGSC